MRKEDAEVEEEKEAIDGFKIDCLQVLVDGGQAQVFSGVAQDGRDLVLKMFYR